MKLPEQNFTQRCSFVYVILCFGNLFIHDCSFQFHFMQRGQCCINTWQSYEARTAEVVSVPCKHKFFVVVVLLLLFCVYLCVYVKLYQ